MIMGFDTRLVEYKSHDETYNVSLMITCTDTELLSKERG